ncbi:MAG: pantetheine-phosphate adenylyltransferase [Phycisphaerae bacterium]
MNEHKTTLAVFPGTFDPITNGHLDVIERGAALFDELIVAVGSNPDKASLLPASVRAGIVQEVVTGLDLGNVRVESYAGLTVDFARAVGANVLLRGIRDGSGLQFEAQVALTNRHMTGVETVFVLPSPEYSFISSGLIRQIVREDGDISSLVPPEVVDYFSGEWEPQE